MPHQGVHCKECRPALNRFLNTVRVSIPTIFPRQMVQYGRIAADDPLAYMEASLIRAAARARLLPEILDRISMTVSYQEDAAQRAEAEREALAQARTIARDVLLILQPEARLYRSVPQQLLEGLLPPQPMDPFQEFLTISRGLIAMLQALEITLRECPCYSPMTSTLAMIADPPLMSR